MKKTYLEAIFIKEGKYRFICTILINNNFEECYVSSSSKLSKYINLDNKKIVVSENNDKNLRTSYTLEAVEIEDKFLYLNFNNANNLYKKYLLSIGIEEDTIQREIFVNEFVKTDFLINSVRCIEVKSLLSSEKEIIFPDKSSKRISQQLQQYINLLKIKTPITFSFIDMSNNITNLEWLNNKIQYDFILAVKLGLQIEVFSVIYHNDSFMLIENTMLKNNIITNLY